MKMKIILLMLVLTVGTTITGCNKNVASAIETETADVTETESEMETIKESETERASETEVESESEVELKLSREQQYIMDLFQLILGREADEKALEYFEKLLLDENKGVRHVILILFQSEEFKNRKLEAEEFVKILFEATLGRKASREELKVQSKDLEEYSDYMVLLVHFLDLEEFSKDIEIKEMSVGSIPSINGEVVILNDGLIVTTAEKYDESKDNIKFKYPVPKGKQNIVVELKVEEAETEVETKVIQEQPQTTNNTWSNSNSEDTNTGNVSASVPAPTTEIPQQTPVPQPQTQQQTEPQPQQTQAPVWVVTKAAWEEEIPVYEWQIRAICACGFDLTGAGYTQEQIGDHLEVHALAREPYGSWATKMVEVQVGTTIIKHPEEGYWK